MALFKALRGDSSRISTQTTPFHDGYVYLTTDDGGFFVDAATADGNQRIRINPKSKSIQATLLASGWANGEQTLSLDGVTAQTNGFIGLTHSISDEALTAAKSAELFVSGQGDGTITIAVSGDTPTVDIPVVAIVLH